MKKQSASQTNVPAWLEAQIATAQKMVVEHERRGNKDTYWHSELARRLAAAADYYVDEAEEPEPAAPQEDEQEELDNA